MWIVIRMPEIMLSSAAWIVMSTTTKESYLTSIKIFPVTPIPAMPVLAVTQMERNEDRLEKGWVWAVDTIFF